MLNTPYSFSSEFRCSDSEIYAVASVFAIVFLATQFPRTLPEVKGRSACLGGTCAEARDCALPWSSCMYFSLPFLAA